MRAVAHIGHRMVSPTTHPLIRANSTAAVCPASNRCSHRSHRTAPRCVHWIGLPAQSCHPRDEHRIRTVAPESHSRPTKQRTGVRTRQIRDTQHWPAPRPRVGATTLTFWGGPCRTTHHRRRSHLSRRYSLATLASTALLSFHSVGRAGAMTAHYTTVRTLPAATSPSRHLRHGDEICPCQAVYPSRFGAPPTPVTRPPHTDTGDAGRSLGKGDVSSVQFIGLQRNQYLRLAAGTTRPH